MQDGDQAKASPDWDVAGADITSDAGAVIATDAEADGVADPAAYTPDIRSPQVELPPRQPAMSRRHAAGLALAASLHVAIVVPMLEPDRRIGGAGKRPDAIGVDLVVLSAALEGRIGTPMRGSIATPGREQAAEPEDAAADLRKALRAEPPAQPASDPDLSIPGLMLRPALPEHDPSDPAHAGQTGGATSVTSVMTSAPGPTAPFLSPLQSAPALQSDAAEAVSAAAAGGETVDVTAAALALSRAGRRDRYGAAVFAALRDNLPRPIVGASAKVTIEFTISPSGQAETIRVAVSSGIGKLDEAALAAVRATSFPAPPADVPPRDLIYTMEYTFADAR